MTRKDYKIIAAAVREAPIDGAAKFQVALSLARRLGQDSATFDRDQFIDAASGNLVTIQVENFRGYDKVVFRVNGKAQARMEKGDEKRVQSLAAYYKRCGVAVTDLR